MPKPGFKSITVSDASYFKYMQKKKYWEFVEGKKFSLAEFIDFRILGPHV